MPIDTDIRPERPQPIRRAGAAPFAALLAALLLFVGGCAGSKPYRLGPPKTFDPDTTAFQSPVEKEENMYWDRVDLSVFHQLEKPLNLNWAGRTVGRALGIAEADEADNVNVMDEPPTSSWYARRHYYDPMTPREMAVGPNVRDTTGPAAGPDTSGTWTITSGKMEGASRGFFIDDARGDTYVIKLDGPRYPELMSSAEVISTKILHAAGYHVPQNTVTYFDPDQLVIAEGARIRDGATRRPMRRGDLADMLADYERRDDGRIRAMASKFVDGRPLGPFDFRGRRDDDPNDRVRHEQRRELRGLRVIGSWLNDSDRRAANTLAVFTEDDYIKHYIFDMGSTLGANASGIHRPIHGQAYMIDQRKIPQALLGLGAFRFPWWDYDPTPRYPSVGYFRADVFRPGEWVPSYPNPAFEKMTRRDAFWGAKIVMSFTDAHLRAIVETAQMSNPEAEAHLLDVLQERRDMIGRYWFARINPLDRFEVTGGPAPVAAREPAGAERPPALVFEDLAVAGGLADAEGRRYRYAFVHDGDRLAPARETDSARIPLRAGGRSLRRILDERGGDRPDGRVVRADVHTLREEGEASRAVRVWVYLPADGPGRVVGLERE
jgi:hypothetical protein